MWLECVLFDLMAHIANVDRSAVSGICSKLRNLDIFNLYCLKYKKLGGNDNIVDR